MSAGKTEIVKVETSRCTVCGSTEREPYFGVVETEYMGVTPEGDHYTHIVRRRTRCRNCLQCRVDCSFENRLTCSESEQETSNADNTSAESAVDLREETESHADIRGKHGREVSGTAPGKRGGEKRQR